MGVSGDVGRESTEPGSPSSSSSVRDCPPSLVLLVLALVLVLVLVLIPSIWSSASSEPRCLRRPLAFGRRLYPCVMTGRCLCKSQRRRKKSVVEVRGRWLVFFRSRWGFRQLGNTSVWLAYSHGNYTTWLVVASRFGLWIGIVACIGTVRCGAALFSPQFRELTMWSKLLLARWFRISNWQSLFISFNTCPAQRSTVVVNNAVTTYVPLLWTLASTIDSRLIVARVRMWNNPFQTSLRPSRLSPHLALCLCLSTTNVIMVLICFVSGSSSHQQARPWENAKEISLCVVPLLLLIYSPARHPVLRLPDVANSREIRNHQEPGVGNKCFRSWTMSSSIIQGSEEKKNPTC